MAVDERDHAVREAAGGRTRRVGLLAAPELPGEIATELAEELPAELVAQHDGRWSVELADEPLLAGREGVEEIIDIASEARDEHGWAAAICLTDIPLRDGARPLVAAVDRRDKVAIVDVPAFGATLLKPRVSEAAVALVGDIAEEALAGDRRLVRARPGDALAPIRRDVVPGERADVRYLLPAVLGHLRLLTGMVRANRPWRAFTGLTGAVVAAFGTGAYALLSSTIWQLSARLPAARLAAVMVVAVVAMVAWLVSAHGLWENGDGLVERKDAALYNAATVLTLTLAVLFGYAALFLLLLAVSALVIEGHVYKSDAGRSAGFGAYLALAWLGAAVATVAGALGSKIESEEEVRRAAYGHNQARDRDSGDVPQPPEGTGERR
jgi:hypothetical protein